MIPPTKPPLVFHVGDTVVWRSINMTYLKRVPVIKVGRSLVYIKGDKTGFRMDDGQRNDEFHHERIVPEAVYNWEVDLAAAVDVLRRNKVSSYGVEPAVIFVIANALREYEKEVMNDGIQSLLQL